MENPMWFKLIVDTDEVKTSLRMTVLWISLLLVHILRFPLLTSLSAWIHKPQFFRSQTPTERTPFVLSRDLEN